MHLVKNVESDIPSKETRTFHRLQILLANFYHTPFPIRQIHKFLSNSPPVSWKRSILSSLSTCRLLENLIQIKLPALQDIAKALYAHSITSDSDTDFASRNLWGADVGGRGWRRIAEYLKSETGWGNGGMSEYRRMGEMLAFEQYVEWLL
eukprot:TRINITY_DN9369_c0_g1_i27.p2 TRINITY_DN9369_c0_g1~~TRINITY_DN9369_c0_g1_i27.p2  ORF type:complete len:150 (+),score=17.78 TRINITY_DN9369_c0_g1_i27:191-640(+)